MNQITCPNEEQLRDYVLGKLPEDVAEQTERHLQVCPACEATAEGLETEVDSLIEQIQQPSSDDPYLAEPQCQVAVARAKLLTGKVVLGTGRSKAVVPIQPAALGRLGEYELLAKLGEGGMGAVYKARQTRLKKIVALKVLPKERTADPRAVTRFEREMEAVGQLAHPNIVQAHDARDIEGTTVLVMEYVDGKDLGELLKCLKSLRIPDACELVRQTALGLQYAHEHGLVHRDIKPSNLMLTTLPSPSGRGAASSLPSPVLGRGAGGEGGLGEGVRYEGIIKILDLGLALLSTDRPQAGELTGTGAAMGTADYMAPEQVSDAHAVDIRADIYSLGCTLYKLLTGQAPFSGPQYKTAAEKLVGHLKETPPPVQQLRRDVPRELAAVIERMMAKSPDERFATPADVAAAIAPFAAGCDLGRVAADAAAAEGIAAEENSLAVTEPLVSSGVVGTDAGGKLPSPVLGRGAGGEGRWPRLVAVGLAGMAAAAIVVWLAVITLRTSQGTVIIDVNEKDADEIKVGFEQNGNLVKVADKKQGWTVSLNEGAFDVAVQGGVDQFEIEPKTVTVKRNGQTRVTVTLKPHGISDSKSQISEFKCPLPAIGSLIGPDGKWNLPPGAPPPAIAPFDAKKAKEHQAAWAKYLGVPVEITNSIGMKLVLIPPGEFDMGSLKELIEEELKTAPDGGYKERVPGEGPRHQVRITRPFYFGVFAVTQEDYQRVMGKNPSYFSATGKSADRVAGQDTKRFPVEMVSWQDADEFCLRLSEMPEEKSASRCYRLPSEAQWEYACRAGTTARWNFSPASSVRTTLDETKDKEGILSDRGWFLENSGGRTHAVGEKQANAWGLHDMCGNVWQWCQDWYGKDYYARLAKDDPAGPISGSDRVLRGGGWDSGAWCCRPAHRSNQPPEYRYFVTGFRVSLSLPEKASEQVAVPDKPIVPPTPVHLDLKPDAKAWDLKSGSPLNPASLVLKPAAIKGLRSWTLEACNSRGGDCAGQLSPDDKLYATGGHDGVIRFLDPTSGKLRIALVNPELDLMSLTWSPNSMYVAVGSRTGVVRIWNVANGTLVVGPTSLSTNQISSLAWSPDGTLLAIARSGESAIMLWDVREAKQRSVLQEQDNVGRSMNYVVWSADGKQLMATSNVDVRIWDVATARIVRTLDPQSKGERLAAAWSPDGMRVAILFYDKVKFFDSTDKLVASGGVGPLAYSPPCARIAWSPDGRHLAFTWFNGCNVLNTASGLQEFGTDALAWGYWADVGSGPSWSKDSSRLLCSYRGSGTATAMDARSGKLLWQLPAGFAYAGTRVCISPDGRQYATAVFFNRLYTWDATQGALVHDYGPIFPNGHNQVAWSNNGRLAAVGGSWVYEKGGRVWDPGEPSQSHLYHDGGYRSAAWSPNGKTLARGGTDVLLWTSDTDDPHQVFHTDAEVWKLAWDVNNSTLAAGLINNKVVILEMPSGKVLRTLTREGLDGGIRCLAALPDGRLVAASGNGAVSVWNSKWEPVGDLFRLKKTVRQGSDLVRVEISVNDGAMPAGGTMIAFATSDGIVLWDADRQVVQTRIGTGPTWSVAWSLPLDRLIAAQDERIAIYDASSGELLASQIICRDPGKHLFLSPEGHMRCSPAMSEDVVYVALTDDGRQVTLRPAEFAAKYGWKNDPEKIRLSSAAADKPRGGK